MADLDAELLALAGGDDSSDEETSVPTQPKLASPPLVSSHEQPESEQSGEMARKGAARLVQRPKKVKKGDEDEEGELYVHSLRHPRHYLSHCLRFPNIPTSSFTHVS
jgi:RNA polymerase-associated protein RTF1